jgi:hypothetical protein
MSFRDDDATYVNENGDTVFTSTFLRNKGRCCKSSCLHCPFGHTLNTIGVKVLDQTDENRPQVLELISELVSTSNITSSLLSDAFGSSKTYPSDCAKLLSLKNVNCGIAYIQGGKVAEVHLKKHFSDQNITHSYIQSVID